MEAVVIVLLVAGHLLVGAMERGTVLPHWLSDWAWFATRLSPRCRNMAVLDCYGSYLGLREGSVSIQGRSMPTTEGWLQGHYVRVSYSPGFWRPWTIVAADTHHIASQLLAERSQSEAAALRAQLRSVGVNDPVLHVEQGRVTLSLPGMHIRNVAVLDAALEVVVAVAKRS